jgi:hypothetical protein
MLLVLNPRRLQQGSNYLFSNTMHQTRCRELNSRLLHADLGSNNITPCIQITPYAAVAEVKDFDRYQRSPTGRSTTRGVVQQPYSTCAAKGVMTQAEMRRAPGDLA